MLTKSHALKKVADRHRLTTLQTKQILYDFLYLWLQVGSDGGNPSLDASVGLVVLVLAIVFSFMISGAKVRQINKVRNT